MNNRPRVTVNGSYSPKFERVRDAFEGNFQERNEVGAAVAVWVDGELAVNLWGGATDTAKQQPWQQDTLASIFSGSKALTSTAFTFSPIAASSTSTRPSPSIGPNSRKPESKTSPSPW